MQRQGQQGRQEVTYSRPGIRQVGATANVPTPDRIRVDNAPRAEGSSSVRVIDRSSPQIAGTNAGLRDAEISNFLGSIMEPVAKVGAQLDVANANRQVGQLLAEVPNIDQLYREGDEDVRNKLRSLSPRANDLMLQRLSVTAIGKFTEGYSSEAQANSILTDPSSTPEARQREESKIKNKWLKESGLSELPPGYLGSYSPQLAQAEALTSGNLDKLRAKRDGIRKDAIRAEALGSDMVSFAGQLEALRTEPDSPEKVTKTKEAVNGLNTRLKESLKETLSSGDGTPTQFLTGLANGVQTKIASALAVGDVDTAQSILDTLQTATKSSIPIGDGKTDLWNLSIPGANGKTTSPQQFILQQQDFIDRFEDKATRKEAIEGLAPLLALATSGDPAKIRQAENQLPTYLATLDPDGALIALNTFKPILNFVQTTTDQQLENYVTITQDPSFQGLSRAEQLKVLKGQMDSGRINVRQFYEYGSRNVDEEKRVSSEVNNAARAAAQEGTTLEPFNRLIGVEQAYAQQNNKPFGEDEARAVQDKAEAQAAKRTADQIREARDAGKPMTPEQVRQAYDTNLVNVVNEREQQLRTAVNTQFNSASDITNRQVNEYLTNVSRGKQGDQRIPSSLAKEMEKLGLTVNQKTALDYLYNKMAKVKGKDGKPFYGQDRNAARLWMQRNYDSARQRSRFAPPPSPAPASGQSKESQGNKPQQQAQSQSAPAFQFASNVLNQVAGALLPGGSSPANAATVVENQEQMETLAQLWERRERPTLTVPPLPQVASATAVQPVTMAIRTPNHPFFVAIGIAEGTRTPNGGYTKNYYGHRDIGDGNWNVGTVSGGRGGGSPQQVDRKWMGSLTRTQMQYAPLLARFGIKPGTQGYNRLMFNVLDLSVQSPLALQTFVTKIPQIVRGNLTVESIAKARADSFFVPGTNRLDTKFKNYSALYADQRSRAGVWDYRRRL